MQIDLAVLCDFANATLDGKLNIIGKFNRINVAQVPFTYPHMAIVIVLKATVGEMGTDHRLRCLAVDQDGKPFTAPIESHFTVPRMPGTEVEFNMIAGMFGVQFQKFGPYSFDVMIDDRSETQIPLLVSPSGAQPGLPGLNGPTP